MNKKQAKQHASNKLIEKEATSDPVSLALVPYFGKGIARLGEINSEIDSYGIQQEKELGGVTVDKGKTRLILIGWMVEVGGAVHSSAHKTGNNTLMSRVNYKQSEIKRLNQPELLSVAGVILEEAQGLSAADLLEEGIHQEDLTTFQNVIAEFDDVQSAPKEAVIDRAGATEKIRALLAEARGIVKNSLDKLAPQYKRKAPEFYRRYKAAGGMKSKGMSSQKPEPVTEPEVPVR